MRVTRLKVDNFRGITSTELHFSGHTLFVGGNNVGKSTICDALDLVLGPDRLYRNPVVDEFDFRNARYLDEKGQPIQIRIEVLLTDLSEEVRNRCAYKLEFWKRSERRLLNEGEAPLVNNPDVEKCLRLLTVAYYDAEEDQFVGRTIYARDPEEASDEEDVEPQQISRALKRAFGFLYLRALRTGSRALSLERGSLLDVILRMKSLRTEMWEKIRTRLRTLDPPIDEDAAELKPVLDEIESRLGEYIATATDDGTRLYVSQLTRQHLRETISFFLKLQEGEEYIPFQRAGTGTLNTLVLALLSFIAEIKEDNVIFAMEEPEIALPPHTQRRIVQYLLSETSQCFVTSHSPYVIERFEPKQIMRLTRDKQGVLAGRELALPEDMKPKTYRSQLRRAIAEAILGHGAIVVEGVTEQTFVGVAAQKMEAADGSRFPLDLAGVTIINTEGDGNLSAMGSFLSEIGIPGYALYDKKKRTAEELQKIATSFTVARESPYEGAEGLLAAEVPVERQWEFLSEVRSVERGYKFGIPNSKPGDSATRKLTIQTLKGLKGEGSAGRLIELCAPNELPATIVAFLDTVYSRHPRGEKVKLESAKDTTEKPVMDSAPAADTGHSGED